MPRPRRSNLSRQSRNARRIQNTANEKTEEEQEIAREQRRDSMARLRASQSREQSEAARETARLGMQNRRANNRSQQIDNLRRRTRYLADLIEQRFDTIAAMITACILAFALGKWTLFASIVVH